jgi:hypothetical protein
MVNSKSSSIRARGAIHLAALLSTASFVAIAASGAAQAQNQIQAQATQAPPEQVLVTGSLIQGAAAVGVPVSDLRPADFVETGKLSITEVLKSVPALRIDAEASPTYGGGAPAKASHWCRCSMERIRATRCSACVIASAGPTTRGASRRSPLISAMAPIRQRWA